jgi:hypothetical protein
LANPPQAKSVKRYHQSMKVSATPVIEGAEAFTRFRAAMQKIVTVPRAEIQRRIEAEREASVANPNRRGPKPKRKH